VTAWIIERRTLMSTTTITNRDIDVDAEGYMQKPEQWDRELAVELALDVGIDELTDRHWTVIEFMRNRYLETGTAPTIRSVGKQSGVPIKELYQLFPKGPAKLAARIGGIPKPKGCI
jgi:tRNA 2-thiouridine synthesizing protein E